MKKSTVKYNHLFGPVPSRRLGLSLGIDLMPPKTCTLDCVYCECGRTSELTLERKEYVPTDTIISELKSFLDSEPILDYLTFSGSGEPTLHSGIGEIISFLKKNYPQYSIALITNSTLLFSEDVQNQISAVDVILPSLDAASEDVFRKINRPVEGITAARIVEGLVSLRRKFRGTMMLEIFIVPGINDHIDELEKLKTAVHQIQPDIVQINSLDRPGTENWVKAARRSHLERIAKFLDWKAEVIALPDAGAKRSGFPFSTELALIQMLKRRPCTIDDLQNSLGIEKAQIREYLDKLQKEKILVAKSQSRGIFYSVTNVGESSHD